MMKIITATGKEFPTRWFGVGSIDGVFRAYLLGETMSNVFSVFTNTEETSNISLVHDTMTQPQELSGYIVFQGVSAEADGIIVGLRRGA